METPPEEVPFEQAFQQLEQLVKNMESDRMPLDQLVAHYERGTRLLRLCQTRIREAEQRIEQIVNGKSAPLEPFAPAASAPGADPAPRKAPARKPPAEESGDAPDEIQLF
jgi:exodeoxyribonuclease VII small subunit